MIARNINLIIPFPPSFLLVLWGRRVFFFLSVSFVSFTIHSLLPRSPLLHINTFIFSRTRLALPLLPRCASTRCAGTPIDGFTLAFAITTPAAAASASTPTPTTAMIHEEGISGNSVEETRSELWFFLSAVLDGCERYIRGRRLGMGERT